MRQTLRVRLLGPLTAWRGDGELDLGPGRQRAVFAVLAIRANQVVSREALIDAVWGDEAPAGAGNSLYSYISRLRHVLGRSSETLVSARSGYSLKLDPGALDVHEFDALREAAQSAWNRRDIAAARTALDSALALWQGDALGGVESPFAASQRKRLGELRLAALERRAEALIAASDQEAVPELRRLVREYPLRESLTGLLMTALHRFGRDDEALAVFAEARRRLIDELGIEPGAALRRVHSEIAAAPRVAVRPSVPDVLVGRERELAVVRARLADLERGRGGTLWVEGGPGAGKSALLATAFADVEFPVVWASPGEVDQLSGPAVIVADDLQDVDDTGLLAWHRLSKLAQREPLLVVGVCRPVPRRTEVDRLRARVGPGGGEVLRLSGLSSDEASKLASLAGVSGSLVDVAAGNPGFVLDVARALRDGSSVTDVVVRWVGFLSEAAQRVLRAAAGVGEAFDLADVASVMGVSVTSLVGAVEEAVDFGFLVESGLLFRFRHGLVRQSLV
ncbi:DNA-binding transcriptional activator of the SARP family [Kibdelosporangium sp. 4NS15]|uniref:DNA-binding transcriptional activator of the SARP family n=1 Tax=Kibdelosporangium persicum TaxID=2698649 RepID=A0ABX2EWA3_9PSEU|nr:BTAD domain-containing putative transcriptional regulator [Kibdelosporangium persicum]NRN63252.1 DNA-binding transcriptional activator of the SARP family [Kibdelosporangium persicum]